MTAQLAPTPVFKAFDNNGNPLAGGKLYTYEAGTTTKQATYTDSIQTTQNTNPIILNFRGECTLWLEPTLSYKFALTDFYGNQIPGYPVDNIPGSAFASNGSFIPLENNTFTLGSPSFSWANGYFGPNGAPLFDPVSGNIGYYAVTASETAAGVTPVNFGYLPGVVDRYANNTIPGTTDMSAAVRLALDSVPAAGGMVQYLPGATYFQGSQVLIPQRRGGSFGQGGIIIEGNNCTVVGPGLGAGATGSGAWTTLGSGSIPSAMFESGTGQFSTVAKGGATNWGLGNETSATLHDNDKIRNINFSTFGMALHLFNFVSGCELSNLYFVNGYTGVSDSRSFYCHWKNLNTSFQQSGSGSTGYATFIVTNTVNDRVFLACHAGGSASSGGAMIGWQVDSVLGCGWYGCSAEQCATGFLNVGIISGAVFLGGYFESNSVAAMNLSGAGAGSVTMEIDGTMFISPTTGSQPIAVTALNWTGGKFGRSNAFSPLTASDNTIVLNGGGNNNTCTVEIPQQYFSEAQSLATTVQVPAGYLLDGHTQLDTRRIVFVSAAGVQSPLVSEHLSNVGAPDFAYSGGPVQEAFETGNWLPFCTQTNASGSSTFLTQITWSSERMVVVFDLVATSGATVQLSGIIFAGGASTLRSDTNTTYTVTPSNSGGKLLLTVAGTGMSGKTVTWRGQIRHV